ncbi:glycosyltransferase family 2 protein [Roseospirillum parvum]|uniref:Glycosyltransferase, catalytic subunit of cellulose synthase and poly-beta-1,6-N-acetylglucosamine synthase n=1 Tax=Roseospirillum parvum TaxID=83401 RepID=A0A1G7YI06_9PROT|nr:glycosyltransferase family 2 protein [Roseospirillum parvum]SDG95849.1 Glycosyltransferase, catalytic subunit of cellulose synthase and poly-beta-1,6-N-acetylglucosamine synthase [Roseospirillum parvum]
MPSTPTPPSDSSPNPRVAVLVPCHNEAATVGQVVADFKAALPGATVYVYDNRSTDDTAALARAAGAVVRREEMAGKGFVVRRMFADVEADIYVLVDGDATYDATRAPELVARLRDDHLDMVVGARRLVDAKAARRPVHQLGNRLLTGAVGVIFGQRFSDMLSGYRVFSRRFVKSFPAASTGFEIETEINVHALQMHVAAAEIETDYFERPEDSHSKLNTWADGFRILWTIMVLFKEVRPFPFFGLIFAALAVIATGLSVPLLLTYMETGLVPRLPTAVLSTGLMLLGSLSLSCGIILDSVCRGRVEVKRLAWLAQPGPEGPAES